MVRRARFFSLDVKAGALTFLVVTRDLAMAWDVEFTLVSSPEAEDALHMSSLSLLTLLELPRLKLRLREWLLLIEPRLRDLDSVEMTVLDTAAVVLVALVVEAVATVTWCVEGFFPGDGDSRKLPK